MNQEISSYFAKPSLSKNMVDQKGLKKNNNGCLINQLILFSFVLPSLLQQIDLSSTRV